MTSIDIIGGVYGEGCSFPHWQEVYGSAGRAAAGLAPHLEVTRLHTVLPTDQKLRIVPIFEALGVDVKCQDGEQLVGFDYLHCLADPKISPTPTSIREQPTFHVDAGVAIMFGMMECNPTVNAEICVYDPQSPNSPKRFSETGSKAKRLAIVANSREISVLTGNDVARGAAQLIESENAEIIVAKCGLRGARLFDRSGEIGGVPAYKTRSVFSIGSGDVFVAAFTLAWAIEGMLPVSAADYASKAVAHYVETSALPIASIKDSESAVRQPVELMGGKVYLAAPFRDLGQRSVVNEARDIIRSLGMDVFSPVHDIGHGPAEKVVKQDLEALDSCDAVFAILSGSSPGTIFEVGYAAAKSKSIFCVAQNTRLNDIKLPTGVGCVIHEDFVSALHLLAWR